MIILRNPQIAELIEAGCAFKSNVIISKNETNLTRVRFASQDCLFPDPRGISEARSDLNITREVLLKRV